MRWPSRRRRSRSKVPEYLGGVSVQPWPWDGRGRVWDALSGVSADLADLDWAWNPTRTPRETKLMLRQQQRLNDLRAQRRDNAAMFMTAGQVVFVDGDPRDFDPTDLVHPTLLGKPRA